MEKNIEKELHTLKTDYEIFREELKVQQVLNERLFKIIRKRPAQAVNREISNRMMLDIITIPIVIMICIFSGWPIMFGILVSLWAAADLCATIWMNHKLGMDNLLNDDVRTVTEKIAGYRKFYDRMSLISILPLVVMLAYIFNHLYARADSSTTVLYITVAGIAFIILACVNIWIQYRKHVKSCRELMEQF